MTDAAPQKRDDDSILFFSVFTNKESPIIFRETHKDMLFCMRCCSRSVASFLKEMIFLHAQAKKSFIIYSSSVDDPKLPVKITVW